MSVAADLPRGVPLRSLCRHYQPLSEGVKRRFDMADMRPVVEVEQAPHHPLHGP